LISLGDRRFKFAGGGSVVCNVVSRCADENGVKVRGDEDERASGEDEGALEDDSAAEAEGSGEGSAGGITIYDVNTQGRGVGGYPVVRDTRPCCCIKTFAT
jgi:hypothetical protein